MPIDFSATKGFFERSTRAAVLPDILFRASLAQAHAAPQSPPSADKKGVKVFPAPLPVLRGQKGFKKFSAALRALRGQKGVKVFFVPLRGPSWIERV